MLNLSVSITTLRRFARAAAIFALLMLPGPPVLADEQLPADIVKILMLPEDQIDTGIAALTFAKEIFPETDIEAESAKIDSLVSEVRALIAANPINAARVVDFPIRAINSTLYLHEGFHYDKSPDARKKVENYFITGILDTKQGMCINMPMLYMAVAQRLGLPVYPVWAPEHVFLRIVDPKIDMQNIEATTGGGYSSDADYIRDLHISEQGIKSGAYLRTMSRRDFLALLLVQNGNAFVKRRNRNRAILYYEAAERLDPTSILAAANLQISYDIKQKNAAMLDDPERAADYAVKAMEYDQKQRELGSVEIGPNDGF